MTRLLMQKSSPCFVNCDSFGQLSLPNDYLHVYFSPCFALCFFKTSSRLLALAGLEFYISRLVFVFAKQFRHRQQRQQHIMARKTTK